MICVLYGSDNISDNLEPIIERQLIKLINTYFNVRFIIGNITRFEKLACSVTKRLSREYYGISLEICLDHAPRPDEACDERVISPPNIHMIKDEYVRQWRDRWMLRLADWVVAYFPDTKAAEADILNLATLECRQVINLADANEPYNT